jgi:hypothetical protein
MAMNHIMFGSAHVVYRVIAPALPGFVFIGACPIRDFANLTDAWTYETFARCIVETVEVVVTVIGIYHLSETAEQVQQATATIENVWINLHDKRVEAQVRRGQIGKSVLWVEKNEIFTSAAKAARAIDVSPTSMSLHLRGHMENIRGQHFKYVGF